MITIELGGHEPLQADVDNPVLEPYVPAISLWKRSRSRDKIEKETRTNE
jgi:hypothetical protein